jgi:hypothetical protein
MYEAIIIWDTGEKEIYQYNTKEEAERCCQGYRMAFGKQIAWTGTRERRI